MTDEIVKNAPWQTLDFGQYPSLEKGQTVARLIHKFLIEEATDIKTLGDLQEAVLSGYTSPDGKKYELAGKPYYGAYPKFFGSDLPYNTDKFPMSSLDSEPDNGLDAMHLIPHIQGDLPHLVEGEDKGTIGEVVLYGYDTSKFPVFYHTHNGNFHPVTEPVKIQKAIDEKQQFHALDMRDFVLPYVEDKSFYKMDDKNRFHFSTRYEVADNGVIDLKNSKEVLPYVIRFAYGNEKFKNVAGKYIGEVHSSELPDMPKELFWLNDKEMKEVNYLADYYSKPNSNISVVNFKSAVANNTKKYIDELLSR